MLDDIGTFEEVGITEDDVVDCLEGFCNVNEVYSVKEITDGVNVAAIVSTDVGSCFLKFNTFQTENSIFMSQPFILEELQSYDSFKTVAPIGYDFSRDDVYYEWYVTEVISGESKEEYTLETAREIGHILGEINSIPVNGVGFPTSPVEGGVCCDIDGEFPFDGQGWEKSFKSSVMKMLRTSDNQFREVRFKCEDFVEDISIRSVTPHLLHFDFWWENLLWDGDNEPVVIDWERAVGGDPLANMLLAEHLLFDSVTIECDWYEPYDSDTREMLREEFRNAYERSYHGSVSLEADKQTQKMYRLLPFLRELRGFPYWWKDESDEWCSSRSDALREVVKSYIN